MSQAKVMLILFVLTGCTEAPQPTNGPSPSKAVETPTMGNAKELYRQGTELLESDPAKAIEYLTQSLELNPNAPPALYNRAAAYARVGRDDEAVADINRLEKVAPEIGQQLRAKMALASAPYVDLGNREFEAGNFEQALKKYNSALAYDPVYGDAWVGKGLALKKLGKTGAAMESYNKAAEVEPDNYYAYVNRAELKAEQKLLQEAIADFTKAIELSPERPEPYEGRADVYKQAEMLEEARLDQAKSEELKAKVKDAPARDK